MLQRLVFVAGLLLAASAAPEEGNPSLRSRAADAQATMDATLSRVANATQHVTQAAEINAHADAAVKLSNNMVDKLMGDFFASGEQGLTPKNFRPAGDNKFTLTVRPYEEAVRITSPKHYTGGRFEFRCKTASVTPGIITAVYMASGDGRTSDSSLGKQDEIDMEWKGNTPDQVQTNVFISGKDASQVTYLGHDSSTTWTDYAIEWNDYEVIFEVDGNTVRRVNLPRPLKPMQLQLAVWTTIGGWPGLIKWAGSPDWSGRNNKPATAEFEILSVPNDA